MTLRKPPLWFRGLVVVAQGVFYNFFCRFTVMFVNNPQTDTSRSLKLPHLSENLSSLCWIPRGRGHRDLVSRNMVLTVVRDLSCVVVQDA